MLAPVLFGLSTIVPSALALGLSVVAYWKDPGLPWMGAKTPFLGCRFLRVPVVRSLACPSSPARAVERALQRSSSS